MSILSSIFGDANAHYIKSLQPIVDRINLLENDYEKLSDIQLKEKTAEFRKLISEGNTLDDLLPEALPRSGRNQSAPWVSVILMFS